MPDHSLQENSHMRTTLVLLAFAATSAPLQAQDVPTPVSPTSGRPSCIPERTLLDTAIGGTGNTVSSGLPEGNFILTFDDGGTSFTKEQLVWLNRQGARAMFFRVGHLLADGNPQRRAEVRTAVRNILSAGHMIGNHSFYHADWGPGSNDFGRNWIGFRTSKPTDGNLVWIPNFLAPHDQKRWEMLQTHKLLLSLKEEIHSGMPAKQFGDLRAWRAPGAYNSNWNAEIRDYILGDHGVRWGQESPRLMLSRYVGPVGWDIPSPDSKVEGESWADWKCWQKKGNTRQALDFCFEKVFKPDMDRLQRGIILLHDTVEEFPLAFQLAQRIVEYVNSKRHLGWGFVGLDQAGTVAELHKSAVACPL